MGGALRIYQVTTAGRTVLFRLNAADAQRLNATPTHDQSSSEAARVPQDPPGATPDHRVDEATQEATGEAAADSAADKGGAGKTGAAEKARQVAHKARTAPNKENR